MVKEVSPGAAMITDLRITVLVDDTARDSRLRSEHGLSFWIEAEGRKILFDTGQGEALEPNAQQLGVDLGQTDAIVISHGHYDHTGGLPRVLARSRRAVLYIHPLAFESKYSRREKAPGRPIGIPEQVASELLERDHYLTFTRRPTRICSGVSVTGQIPRLATFESTSGPFFLNKECTRKDVVADDQALYIESRNGLVVVLGCGHSGVVNTLDYVAKLTGKRSMRAVLGGMHLAQASEERIVQTSAALDRYGVRLVAPCHCSGERAIAKLRSRLGERVVDCSAGASFSFLQDFSRSVTT
jgi:7,8-dihydropterin-6-yl-methyl-4-(beta-D-ribofuranosyl)aminobenzene 5'-phosphate synthase